MPSITDKQLQCSVCGAPFIFTVEEQAFYESKGFQEPRKCKSCRDAAKQQRNTGEYTQQSGYGRPQRQLYDAVCSACGVHTQVPFQPSGSKPVYCRECFQNQS